MLIVKESDYAVRVIRALKLNEKLTVREICKREEITEPFAYKILQKLKKAGIVRVVRGSKGGYQLKKQLEELSLYDIIVIIDPDFAITHCMKQDCTRNTPDHPCRLHLEFQQIQNNLSNELKARSLKEILED